MEKITAYKGFKRKSHKAKKVWPVELNRMVM